MASIRKLESRAKPWQVRIRRKGQEFTEYFRTKKEADAFAATVEADFDKWSKLLGGELRRHTLADLIDRYLTIHQGKDHNLPSRLAWWKERYGKLLLSEFSSDTARDALAGMEIEPVARGANPIAPDSQPRTGPTINRYKSALSACYKAGIDRGWFGLQSNPLTGIRARKEVGNRFGRSLEDGERERLVAACERSTYAGMGIFVRLALATGARRGELVKLEWRDVDLKGGSILLRNTKNGDDRRVPLIGEARDRLTEWAKVRKLDDPRVFPGSTPTRPPNLERAWSKAKEVAGVENLRIHDLRHSCGSYLAKAGASAFQIAAILGHRSGPGLTARYVHLVAEDSRALMESALSGITRNR
ncbi:site-specific integrase [Thiocystis violascens]|uniref:Site-specific recombinase XerD n=1 Tax=Thiocystis violascens (strain ATCC 17096 / DSM 198 / 6111) TaxID=765911 RepID=I3YET0_THIV6|nr:site-specific integrase [Thiocystis violascens]AFL75498.1 site-specific recombinase XerD [Thiocystis violascens DSM 198]